jgi:hypothetical protein
LKFCLSYEIARERFDEPLILEARGFDEALPALASQLRREADPSVLRINEAGLVVVRKVPRWSSKGSGSGVLLVAKSYRYWPILDGSSRSISATKARLASTGR